MKRIYRERPWAHLASWVWQSAVVGLLLFAGDCLARGRITDLALRPAVLAGRAITLVGVVWLVCLLGSIVRRFVSPAVAFTLSNDRLEILARSFRDPEGQRLLREVRFDLIDRIEVGRDVSFPWTGGIYSIRQPRLVVSVRAEGDRLDRYLYTPVFGIENWRELIDDLRRHPAFGTRVLVGDLRITTLDLLDAIVARLRGR